MKEMAVELVVEEDGERLDRYVAARVPELSRAAVQRLVSEKHIVVDRIARRPSYRLTNGEIVSVRIPPPLPAQPQAQDIKLDLIYEDEDLLVVDKPAGMVVHPAAGHPEGTLVNAVLKYVPNLSVGGEERPGIVHRLDADTSGLILVAKNDMTMRYLQAQFKNRAVRKTYLALVEGQLNPPSGRIEAPIGRDLKHRQKMSIVTSGGKAREATTVYHTLANLGGYTLVKADPKTGRTHQIRVHLAYLGFPVVGDRLYGSKRKIRFGLGRHFLHAWKISLILPSGRAADFTAQIPQDLRQVLEGLNPTGEILQQILD